MSPARVLLLTSLTMLAFAGNALLCRLALEQAGLDAASFTSLRLLSGASMLWLLVRLRQGTAAGAGNWLSAAALFAYAAGFSFAYVRLPTGSGALLLFGAVQATMIGHGLWQGERLRRGQGVGLLLACTGLIGLLLPGVSAPPPGAALLMLGAGMAWGLYSLRGKGAGDPLRVTAGNFLRTLPMAWLLSLAMLPHQALNGIGIAYAVASGALASGVGYAIWYRVLPAMTDSLAATVKLSVPVIAALGGTLFLDEPLSLRLLLASLAVLGGIALVILKKRPA